MTDDAMPDDTKADLAVQKLQAQRDALPDGFDFKCLGPGCDQVMRKPRFLAFGTKVRCATRQGVHRDDVVPDRRATWCWCSQACLDAWNAKWKGRLPGTAWPKYDVDRNLLGYVVPGRGFVSVDEIDAARSGGI